VLLQPPLEQRALLLNKPKVWEMLPETPQPQLEDINNIEGHEIINGMVQGKVPLELYKQLRESSIKNPDGNSMLLGRYTNDESSYIQRAGTEHMYFDMEKSWNSVEEIYDVNDIEMFDLFNRPALDDAISGKKNFIFSHDPRTSYKSFLYDEWEYIKEQLNLTDDNLLFDGGLWYVK
jgi:hypothetical protein